MTDRICSAKEASAAPATDCSMVQKSAPASIDLERFNHLGYLVIPGVFSRQEISVWRQRIELALDEQDRSGTVIKPAGAAGLRVFRGELANSAVVRPVVLDPRIAAVAREILGESIVYYGDSSIHHGNRDPIAMSKEGWHRDCPGIEADPENIVWKGDYPLIRVGIYFQDHTEHSGGLSLVPGSHADQGVVEPKTPIECEPGDLIVWNQRVLHVGHTFRQGMEPDGERLALFVSFAQQSPQLDHYLRWMGGGSGWMGDRVVQDRWRSTIVDQPFVDALKEAGVKYRSPLSSFAGPHTQ